MSSLTLRSAVIPDLMPEQVLLWQGYKSTLCFLTCQWARLVEKSVSHTLSSLESTINHTP